GGRLLSFEKSPPCTQSSSLPGCFCLPLSYFGSSSRKESSLGRFDRLRKLSGRPGARSPFPSPAGSLQASSPTPFCTDTSLGCCPVSPLASLACYRGASPPFRVSARVFWSSSRSTASPTKRS